MIRLKKRGRLYDFSSRRAEWKRSRREEALPVRGIGRQVVVVRSPDPQVFEEAIFVLREDWIKKRSADQVIEEARRAAGEYLSRHGGRRRRSGEWLRALLYGALGALAAAAAWITLHLTGV